MFHLFEKKGLIMALETLKGIKNIGGFDVIVMDDLRKEKPELFNESGAMDYKVFERDIRPHNFIYLRNDVHSISFTMQNGTLKEKGVNGVQVDEIIETAKIILEGLNHKFKCSQNEYAITALEVALSWLRMRREDREKRGVEGESKA